MNGRVLGFLAVLAACRSADAPEPPPPPARVEPADAELDELRALLARAEAARAAQDLASARELVTSGIARALDRREDEEWVELLQRMASLAHDSGQLRAAEQARRRVLEVRMRTLPADGPDVQTARRDLGRTLYELGERSEARALFEEVLDVLTRRLPGDHPDLQEARLNLGGAKHSMGDLQGARSLFEQVVEVDARTLPDDHPDLLRARNNLAATLSALGELVRARDLEVELLEVRSRTLADDDPELLGSRQNLGTTLAQLGDLDGARILLEKVLEVRSRTLPEDHPELQVARVNVANTIRFLGELERARVLYQKALEGFSRILPADHPYLRMTRGNLASVLGELGDREGARALEEQVLADFSRTLPDDHPHLQVARQNLANTIRDMGDVMGARALQEKVLEVRARTLPDDHPDLQAARTNLAKTMRTQGDLRGARTLLEQALVVRLRALPEDHPDLQSARQNLAATLVELNEFAEAATLLEQVLASYSRRLPEDHTNVQYVRHYLAATLALSAETSDQRGRSRCIELLLAACRSRTRVAREVILTSPPRSAEERCESLTESFDVALTFAFGFGNLGPLPGLDRTAFVLGETTRGAGLASAAWMRAAARDPDYLALRKRLQEKSDALAGLAQAGTTEEAFQASLAERERAEQDLVDLARRVPGASSASLEFDPDALADRLAAGEAVVGYRRYERQRHDPARAGNASADFLCAFVLRRGPAEKRLALVDLGPAEPVEKAVRAWRESLGIGADVRGVAAGAPARGTDSSESRGRELRRLVLDPLSSALRGADRVILALDDVLHLVPLDCLPAEDSASSPRLGDRIRIETRVTLTEILASGSEEEPPGDLVLVGGVEYGSAEDVEHPRGRAGSTVFAELPETRLEVRTLAERFAGAEPTISGVTLLEGSDATRGRWMEAAPRARWLHVATHGWFAPETVPSWSDRTPLDEHTGLGLRLSSGERIRGSSPMLLCGLALAGANLPEDALGRPPGLVTAEELSALDLARCELAVLSACETNLGVRRAGQGVASLQKALRMAGARSVITSLWKVPDAATRELMTEFYRRIWVEKQPKARALWEAKRRLRDQIDEKGKPRFTTRDWAAWVLTGDPE